MNEKIYNQTVIEILHELSELNREIQMAVWLKLTDKYAKLTAEYWSNMRQLNYLRK